MISMIEPDAGESVPFLYADLAYLSLWTGSAEQAATNFDRSLRWVDDFGLREGEAIKHDFSGWSHFYEGAHDAAVGEWAKAEAIYVELEQRTWVIDMQQLQSWARLIGGGADVRELVAATEEASRLGLRPFVARGTMLQAIETDSGELLRDALRLAHSAGSRVSTYWSLWYGAHRAARAGRSADAKVLYRWAERYRSSIPLALPAALAEQDDRLRGKLGNLRAARGTIEDADISELSALIPD
jgi:hypothetical protein